MEEPISYADQRVLIVTRSVVIVIENVVIVDERSVGPWIIFGIHIRR